MRLTFVVWLVVFAEVKASRKAEQTAILSAHSVHKAFPGNKTFKFRKLDS